MFNKLLFLILPLIYISLSNENVGNIRSDYRLKFLSNPSPLKLDPDFSKSIEQIVTSRGYIFNYLIRYPLETHYVNTKDGYILKVYRIPGGKNSTTVNSKPCLLAHGLLVYIL